MRDFFKKSIPVIVILSISVSVPFGYKYAKGHLRDFAYEFLESNFNSKIAIGEVGIRLPICFELKDIRIGDSVEIPIVQVYPVPSPLAWRNGFITAIVKVIRPVVRIGREDGRGFIAPIFLKNREKNDKVENKVADLYFSKIHIQNGRFIYDSEGDDPLEFVRIEGSIRPTIICFSKDSAFQFAAKAFLKNKDVDSLSPLLISGSVEHGNVVRAKLYGSDVKLGTLGKGYLRGIIDKGAINFESDIEIAKGRLMADCRLKTKDIMASFILLFSFKNKILKIKDLKGNFFEGISNKS